ncbi:MAG: hypothetical protein ACE5GQ_03560 [Nitrospinales bacterium]
MFDPANQNASLSSLTENPKRELAQAEIASLLSELESCYEILPSMLADLLFEFLMIEMEPDDPLTPQTATIWFAKLNRFKDALQSRIDRIEALYEDDQN